MPDGTEGKGGAEQISSASRRIDPDQRSERSPRRRMRHEFARSNLRGERLAHPGRLDDLGQLRLGVRVLRTRVARCRRLASSTVRRTNSPRPSWLHRPSSGCRARNWGGVVRAPALSPSRDASGSKFSSRVLFAISLRGQSLFTARGDTVAQHVLGWAIQQERPRGRGRASPLPASSSSLPAHNGLRLSASGPTRSKPARLPAGKSEPHTLPRSRRSPGCRASRRQPAKR